MVVSLPFAGQPDMVLAAEKDQLQMRELRDQVYSVAEGAFGPQTTTGAKPELNLLSDFFYLLLTTAKGRQTLGEEYCDVYLMSPDARTRLGPQRRRVLALLIGLGPYMMARAASGGWASLWSALKRESARERALALARRAQQQRTTTILPSEEDTFFKRLSRKITFSQFAAILLVAWPVLARIHLAAFYWGGEYLDAAKRLVRARYVFTREPAAKRPTYRILSLIIAIQISMQVSSFVTERLSQGNKDTTAAGDCVPSITQEDAEAMSERNEAVFSNTCGICLSPLKSPACAPCGHVYCYECIVESCVAKSECPLCRREASPQSVQCIYV